MSNQEISEHPIVEKVAKSISKHLFVIYRTDVTASERNYVAEATAKAAVLTTIDALMEPSEEAVSEAYDWTEIEHFLMVEAYKKMLTQAKKEIEDD